MVRIRLTRVGAKKQPSYRIIIADQRAPRDGRFIEIIGHYNPRTEPITMVVKMDRALFWLGRGAQPTPAVERILVKLGVRAKFEAGETGLEAEETEEAEVVA